MDNTSEKTGNIPAEILDPELQIFRRSAGNGRGVEERASILGGRDGPGPKAPTTAMPTKVQIERHCAVLRMLT